VALRKPLEGVRIGCFALQIVPPLGDTSFCVVAPGCGRVTGDVHTEVEEGAFGNEGTAEGSG